MKIYTVLIVILMMNAHAADFLSSGPGQKTFKLGSTSPANESTNPFDLVSGCSSKVSLGNSTKVTADSVFSITKIYSCDPKNFAKADSLTATSCKMATACKNSLLQDSEARSMIDFISNEFVAKESIKWPLENSANRMEKFEVLRSFAKEKYKKDLGQECANRFESPKNDGSCNHSFLDDAFVDYQSNCSMKNGCFSADEQKGTLGFGSYSKQNKKVNASKFTDYFNYRVESKSKEALGGDKDFTEKLATYVTSAEFKKASDDKKSELFEKFLTDNSMIVDPVLGFDLLSGNLKVKDGLKGLPKLVGLFKNAKNKDSFIKDYEKYRETRVKSIFDKRSKVCESVNTVGRICESITNISKGRGLERNNFLAIQKISADNIERSKVVEQLQNQSGGKINPTNADIILNAYKCTAFKLDDSSSSRVSDDLSSALASGDSSRIKVFGEGFFGDPVSSVSRVVLSDDKEFGDGPIGSIETFGDQKSIASSSSSSMSERMDAPSGTDISVAPTHETSANNISNSYDPYSPAVGGNNAYSPMPASVSTSEEAIGVVDNKVTPAKSIAGGAAAGAAADSAEMEKLKARLAAAEASVEKMQADAQAAKDKEAADKKVAEEQALVQSLKDQIADLKKKKDAKEVVSKVADTRPEERDNYVQAATTSYDSGRGSDYYPASREREIVYEDRRVLADDYDRAGGRSLGGASGSNGPGIVLTANKAGAANDRAVTLDSGDIVIAVDGLSADAVNEIMKTNAVSTKGHSFLIEEGGLVKEVFPKLDDKGELVYNADGSLVCDKLVRGRIGDKKFAKAKIANSKREPAAVVAPADVKRSNDNVRDRTKLQDLQKLIKSAAQ